MASIDKSKSERIKRNSMGNAIAKRDSVDSGYPQEEISPDIRTFEDTRRTSIHSNYSRCFTNQLTGSRKYDDFTKV